MSSSLLNFGLENAVQNYVSGAMTATGVTNVNYYKGVTFSGVIQYPCIITQCVSAKRPYSNMNLYNASVNIDYITQIDAPNSFELHTTGVAILRDVLYPTAQIVSSLNPPASGIDTRVEPSLFMYGIVEQEQKPYIVGEGDRRVGQQFSLRFDCSN
jgi:hypothetical protein